MEIDLESELRSLAQIFRTLMRALCTELMIIGQILTCVLLAI